MQRPPSLGIPQNQAAWPALVIGIILYDFTAVGYRLFQLRDADISENALIDRMPGELILTPQDLASDFLKHGHAMILPPCHLLVN
jgi:hypothetical protein